jgi:hypothetical protein
MIYLFTGNDFEGIIFERYKIVWVDVGKKVKKGRDCNCKSYVHFMTYSANYALRENCRA